MNTRNKIISILIFLLLCLSVGFSTLNYMQSLNEINSQFKERSLPLSIDNIFTEVQKNIMEPNLIASMMANDLFLKNWLQKDEPNVQVLSKYLETIKNKYKLFSTFVVSDKTQSYYTSKGFLEKLNKNNPNNFWYFRFKDADFNNEINVDLNTQLANSMILFINYKIFDEKMNYLGATGVALELSYVNNMLNYFKQNYNFNVFFINKLGDVVLSLDKDIKNISDIKQLEFERNTIMSEYSKIIEYEDKGNKYILSTKYIPQLDLYLVVQGEMEQFLEEAQNKFLINLLASTFLTIFVIVLIFILTKDYDKKLVLMETLDPLTKLPNRKTFFEMMDKSIHLFKRNGYPTTLLFVKIKNYEDFHNQEGDLLSERVVIRISDLLKQIVRKTDYIGKCREDSFSIILSNTNIKNGVKVAENIQKTFDEDFELSLIGNKKVIYTIILSEINDYDDTFTIHNRLVEIGDDSQVTKSIVTC